MKDIEQFQERVGEWGKSTFPHSTTQTILAHLRDEITELIEADRDSPLATDLHQEEAADCFILLLHYAHRRGFSLFDAGVVKAAINERRTWSTSKNERGYFDHVRDEVSS